MPTITVTRIKAKKKKSTVVARNIRSGYKPQVRSRHPTHKILREKLERLKFRSIVRLGSITDLPDTITHGGSRIECNTIEAIKNTSDKTKMKSLFTRNNIKSPKYTLAIDNNGRTLSIEQVESLVKYPIIAKTKNHSRGRGMEKLDNLEQLQQFINTKASRIANYMFEEFINYHKEYRIHATEDGIFYACRKLRRGSSEDRWYFNSTNCVFKIVHPGEEPACWSAIQSEVIKALKVLKMDMAGFDVRIDRGNAKFTIIEANSACSFGEITGQKYLQQIPMILKKKYTARISS